MPKSRTRRQALREMTCLAMLGRTSPRVRGANSQDDLPQFDEVDKVDVHVHVFDDLPEWIETMRRIRMQAINICVGGSDPSLLVPCEKRAEEHYRRYSPTLGFAPTFDLTRRDEPGYAQAVIDWIDAGFRSGARFVKIWKDVGMGLKTREDRYLMPDDPVFDPVWEHLAAKRWPLMAHFADPIDAWRPLDPASPHHDYYASHPEWHVHDRPGFPSHDQILEARDRVLARHPGLIVIAAHLGSEAHDLDRLGQRFDRYPNLHADVAARTPELKRQPSQKVRAFFEKHQDRLLYGTDLDQYTPGRDPTPDEARAFAAKAERMYRSEYDYYARSGVRGAGGRQADGLSLPPGVLNGFYRENALRLLSGLANG